MSLFTFKDSWGGAIQRLSLSVSKQFFLYKGHPLIQGLYFCFGILTVSPCPIGQLCLISTEECKPPKPSTLAENSWAQVEDLQLIPQGG